MAWSRIVHRYPDGTETEFASGSDGSPGYPDELRQFSGEVLHLFRELIGNDAEADVETMDGDDG